MHRAKAVADVDVTGDMPESAPVPALLRQDACLVVLGSRGLGGFGGLLLGSTAVQVAAHARCPVVVVRGERSGDVVVGVDGSAHSVEAIAFAFGEAQRLGAGVVAVTAGSQEDEAARALAESVAGWAERYPDVPVRRSVVRGHAARALVDAAADAALLVVGSRGAGGFRGMLLGSVSQGVLHHATCPVAIVRSP
ncbi:universal stress protein [Actinokineospora soli]|uniref:Universal stress protein n=1 Tax=Actinokineospora soli TaxID=1048753 RepID=A0ABW2TPT3_9PSEU